MINLRKINSSILFAIFMMLFFSCNNMEKDAKKIADIQCQALNLLERNKNLSALDNSLVEEAKSLNSQITDLRGELFKKYTSESDREKLESLVAKYTADCKK